MVGSIGMPLKADTLPCLSAFSGIGGLDLGLERAAFSILGAIEIEVPERASLAANRPGLRQLGPHDINEAANYLAPRDLGVAEGELALLAAGPPCQPFSKAAQWSPGGTQGMADRRALCLHSLMTLVQRFRPHVLLIENVPGFVRGRSSALPFLEARLGETNRQTGTRYKLSCRVLNAVDYGVPQRRTRAFVVALRNGKDFQWPAATHRDLPIRAWDALKDTPNQGLPIPRGRFAGLLPAVPEGQNYQYFTERGEGPTLFGYRCRYWSFLLKLAKAQPSWTVPASPGPATGPFHWNSRPLSPQEILRLQSFPASWKLRGSLRQQIRQAGNATPPLMAEVLGRAIATQAFGVDFRRLPLTLAIDRSTDVPPPTPPQSVPAEFLALAGDHAPHPGAGCGPSARLHRPDVTNVTEIEKLASR